MFISYFIRTFASSMRTKVLRPHVENFARTRERQKTRCLDYARHNKMGEDARHEKNGMPITTGVKNAQILLNMEKFYYFCKNIVNYATEIIWV